jgi:hypothetical protein
MIDNMRDLELRVLASDTVAEILYLEPRAGGLFVHSLQKIIEAALMKWDLHK